MDFLNIHFFIAENCRKTGKQALVQVCWSLDDPDTRLREVTALAEAMHETGIKRATIITAFDEKSGELPPGVTVMAAWRWLLRADL